MHNCSLWLVSKISSTFEALEQVYNLATNNDDTQETRFLKIVLICLKFLSCFINKGKLWSTQNSTVRKAIILWAAKLKQVFQQQPLPAFSLAAVKYYIQVKQVRFGAKSRNIGGKENFQETFNTPKKSEKASLEVLSLLSSEQGPNHLANSRKTFWEKPEKMPIPWLFTKRKNEVWSTCSEQLPTYFFRTSS